MTIVNPDDIKKLKTSKVASGRTAVKLPNHPKCNSSGYVLRSRVVMESNLGRYLKSTEEVHHKNKNKTDDDFNNLEVLDKAEHTKHHSEDRRKLDYEKIKRLKEEGLGYKRISKTLNLPLSSVKTSIKIMKREKEIL